MIAKTNALKNIELPMLYAGKSRVDRKKKAEELVNLAVEKGTPVLQKLADEAREQASFWEQKIKEIKKVCEVRGINLD